MAGGGWWHRRGRRPGRRQGTTNPYRVVYMVPTPVQLRTARQLQEFERTIGPRMHASVMVGHTLGSPRVRAQPMFRGQPYNTRTDPEKMAWQRTVWGSAPGDARFAQHHDRAPGHWPPQPHTTLVKAPTLVRNRLGSSVPGGFRVAQPHLSYRYIPVVGT